MSDSNEKEKSVQDNDYKFNKYNEEFKRQFDAVISKSDVLTNMLTEFALSDDSIVLTQLYLVASQLIKNITSQFIKEEKEYSKKNIEAYQNVVDIIMPALSKKAETEKDDSVEFRNLMLTAACLLDHICYRTIVRKIDEDEKNKKEDK